MALSYGVPQEQAFREVSLESRDHARMPFQWDDSPNAGFSDTSDTWLPVNPDYPEINAARQEADPHSLLNWYRQLIALRTDSSYTDVLTYGDFVPYRREVPHLVAYSRGDEERRVLILMNYHGTPLPIRLREMPVCVLLSNYDRTQITTDLTLQPFEAIAIEVSGRME